MSLAVPAVADFLAEALSAHAARIALQAPEGSWTYGQLSELVDQESASLRAAGVRPGTVRAVTLEADVAGLITLLALWRLGVTPAPLHPRLTGKERDQAVEGLTGVGAGAQVILWTSGTSGRPRGVALTADNVRASAAAAARRLDLGPDDTWLASLSLAHVGGLALVSRALLLGSCVAAWGRFSPAHVSALLDGDGLRHAPSRPLTHMSLVPTQLRHLLDLRARTPPPPHFRCVLVGGAHAPPELVHEAMECGWPVALTYGMTEMTSQVATAPPEAARAHPAGVGRPLDGVELKVAPDGEILVRGATRAAGYVGSTDVLADEQGWYHTGDLGALDGEGRLVVLGRRADRILTGGVTVDANEVEAVLRAHPSVRDACVVGVPDPEWGEVVAAAVVVVEGEFDLEELDVWLRERLYTAKRPRRWLRLHALPVNTNGKIDRRAVREAIDPGG
jgi:O-succinylbenzoic acid--CoA ligase